MALDNYANLQTAIISTAMRTGDPDFIAAVPDFIQLCEQRINYGSGDIDSIRCREMEEQAYATLVSGQVELPTDFLEVREVWMTNSGIARELTYGTPGELRVKYAGQAGSPSRYTVIGNTLIVYPTADAVTIDITYFAKLPALSNGNTTNWLLTRAPSIYLYGSLVAAAPFLMDDARISVWAKILELDVLGLKKSYIRHHYSRPSTHLNGPTP